MTPRRIHLAAAIFLALAALVGGATQSGQLAGLLDLVREHLGTVLLTCDLLAEPGCKVTLSAYLREGLRLEPEAGRRVQFFLGDKLLGEATTDPRGEARIAWPVPGAAGDYRVRVHVRPEDVPGKTVEDVELLVAARPKETHLFIVDLDHTVVESDFLHVLKGDARPMPDAAAVLSRIASAHTVVYLTHRPDFLGALSKRWLSQNGFPAGPMLTSTLETLFEGSGTFKMGRLAEIKKTYAGVVFGVGDKVSDAQAYDANGVPPILLLSLDWSKGDPDYYDKAAGDLTGVPDRAQVVWSWSQVSAIVFEKARFSKEDMLKRLKERARDLSGKPGAGGRHPGPEVVPI